MKTNRKTLIIGSLSAMSAKAVAAILALVLNFYIVKIYGVENSESIFLLITGLIISSMFVRFGFDTLIVRLVGRRKTYSNYLASIVRTIQALTLVIWVAVVILAFLFYRTPLLEQPQAAFLFSTSLLFFSLLQINSYVFQGLGKILHHTIFLNLLFSTLCIILSLFLEPLGILANIDSYLYVQSISSLIAFIASSLLLKTSKSKRLRLSKIKALFALNSKYFFFAMVQVALTWMPQIMLYFSLQRHDVPTFTFMHRLSLILGFVLIAISAFFAPRFSRYIQIKDFEAVEREASLFIVISVVCCLGAGLVLYLGTEKTLHILDKDILYNELTLVILFFGQLVNCATGPCLKLLQMNGTIKKAAFIQVIVFLIHLIYGTLYIESYNISTAAFVCTSILISTNIGYTILVYRELKISVYRYLFMFKMR